MSTSYALYTIPAAWVLSILPHFYAVSLANKVDTFDNTNPRNQAEQLKGKMSSSQFGRYQRAESAQQNGFDNLPFFAAAVLAGQAARLPASTLNTASFFYLATRVLYNLLYINTESLSLSNARSIVFLAGVGTCFTLFVKAGNAFNLLL